MPRFAIEQGAKPERVVNEVFEVCRSDDEIIPLWQWSERSHDTPGTVDEESVGRETLIELCAGIDQSEQLLTLALASERFAYERGADRADVPFETSIMSLQRRIGGDSRRSLSVEGVLEIGVGRLQNVQPRLERRHRGQ